MADSDIQITAGSGTKVDTRTVGAGSDEHRQVIVIGDPSVAGNVVLVDGTYGLEVDVSRVSPGTGALNLGKAEDTAHSDGDVGVMMLGVRNHYTGSNTDGDYAAISVGPFGDLNTLRRADLTKLSNTSANLTTATTTYATGDQTGSIFVLPNAARLSNGGGTIVGITLIDSADVIGAMDVVVFDSNVTLAADNATFSISDSDANKIVALVPLAGSTDIGQNRIAQSFNLAIPYICSGGNTLYAALITRSNNAVYASPGNTSLLLNVYVEKN